MGHVLTLDIPDEVYVPLLKQAQQMGKTPEEWADRSDLDDSVAFARALRHQVGNRRGEANDWR